MDILDSAWLLKMLKKSAATPRERLLAMFDILGDWIDAPDMRDRFGQPPESAGQAPQALIEYLTGQATASGAHEPEMLAQQLCFMAVSMLQEELRAPGCAASRHAQQVAQALIRAQTERDRFISKRSAYAVAAGVFLCTAIGSSLLLLDFNNPLGTNALVATAAASSGGSPATQAASPLRTAAMFASLEEMRGGTCQYPEALMLPDSQKGVYLENVVGGQVPTVAKDQELAGQLMQKVRCNYTPMLMKNSTG